MARIHAIRRAWIRGQELAISALLNRRWNTARAPHLITGERGELATLFYLRSVGYIITARRWQSARYRGDIDLVGWDGDALCFIEVKTRTRRDEAFTAESAVDADKRRNLRRLAALYIRQSANRPTTVRFDVVSLYAPTNTKPEFQLLRGAFPLRPEMP